MTLLHDAYTAWLSGLTHKTGNEIHWENKYGNPITVELIDAEQEKYIVRDYWENGNVMWEEEYQNSQPHGKNIGWHYNGNKLWEVEYQNGQPHGKNIGWHDNGNKQWEGEYQNGQPHGKSIGWYENGNVMWEEEYQNGECIRKIL